MTPLLINPSSDSAVLFTPVKFWASRQSCQIFAYVRERSLDTEKEELLKSLQNERKSWELPQTPLC